MAKKIIYVALLLVTAIAFTACNSNELVAYKVEAKTKIDAHAATKTKSDYSANNWAAILQAVDNGKAAVDEAICKDGVDSAVEEAKRVINDIPLQGENMKLKQGVYTTEDKIGRIELYGDNLFVFSVIYVSNAPSGSYSTNDGRLILHCTDNFDLYFDIEKDKLLFIGAYTSGLFLEDGSVQVGTIFKLTFYEVETDDMIELHTWHFTSGIPNNIILVKYPNDNAIFECVVDSGNLWLMGPLYEKSLSVKPNESFRWQTEIAGTNQAFIDIIVKIDDYIVGYAVIKISSTINIYTHSPAIIKSVFIPKVDGKYQIVTEEQVKAAIEQVKAK